MTLTDPEPDYPHSTVLDARDATPPPRFEVKAPAGAPNVIAAIGRLTGLAYTLKNAELRSRVVEVTRSSYEFGAGWLRSFDPGELPMPPEDLCAWFMP